MFGYWFIGDDIIICFENGLWSGFSLVCERIFCFLLNDIIVLSVLYFILTVGGNVYYICL